MYEQFLVHPEGGDQYRSYLALLARVCRDRFSMDDDTFIEFSSTLSIYMSAPSLYIDEYHAQCLCDALFASGIIITHTLGLPLDSDGEYIYDTEEDAAVALALSILSSTKQDGAGVSERG